MDDNPWHVDSIQAFCYLKCPECGFDTKEDNLFEDHATENHPMSIVLFEKEYVKTETYDHDIKSEPPDNVFENDRTENHNEEFEYSNLEYSAREQEKPFTCSECKASFTLNGSL